MPIIPPIEALIVEMTIMCETNNFPQREKYLLTQLAINMIKPRFIDYLNAHKLATKD